MEAKRRSDREKSLMRMVGVLRLDKMIVNTSGVTPDLQLKNNYKRNVDPSTSPSTRCTRSGFAQDDTSLIEPNCRIAQDVRTLLGGV